MRWDSMNHVNTHGHTKLPIHTLHVNYVRSAELEEDEGCVCRLQTAYHIKTLPF